VATKEFWLASVVHQMPAAGSANESVPASPNALSRSGGAVSIGEPRRNQDRQNGRNVISGTQGIGRSTAHRARPSLTKKRAQL
jgi:hypothetical protein